MVASKQFQSFGEFLACVAYRRDDKRLVYQEVERRGQSMDTGVEGGFAVPERFIPEILSLGPDSIVRPRALVLQNQGDGDATVQVPSLDPVKTEEPEFVVEGATKPDTGLVFGQIKLAPQEMTSCPVVSNKLLRNIPGGGPVISGILRDQIAQKENEKFLIGSGVAEPMGALNAPCRVEISRATAGAIGSADLAEMLAALLPGGEPVWVASPSTATSLASLMDSGNGNVLGLPLLWSRQLPALGNRGDLALCDFSKYVVADGSGVLVDISLEHPDHYIKNEALVRVTTYVDAAPWLSDKVSDLSPFVILQ